MTSVAPQCRGRKFSLLWIVVACLVFYRTIGIVSTTTGTRASSACRQNDDTPEIRATSNMKGYPTIPSILNGWETTSAIYTISFGKATETKLLERLVYSLRGNGNWKGLVFVITDQAKAYENRLKELNLWDTSSTTTILLQAKEEDLYPKNPASGQPIEFKTDSMRYKRFKTLFFNYLEEPYKSSIGHVLYLDVEIVIARPIQSLFQDYFEQMIQRQVFLDAPHRVTVNSTLPFMTHFSDCPKCARQNFNLNGGAFLLYKGHDCLEEWKSLFALGATYATADQRYLVTMKASGTCRFYQLPDVHRIYPTRRDMRLKQSATVVHNTNTYQAQNIPLHLQKGYFDYLLGNHSYFHMDEIESF